MCLCADALSGADASAANTLKSEDKALSLAEENQEEEHHGGYKQTGCNNLAHHL